MAQDQSGTHALVIEGLLDRDGVGGPALDQLIDTTGDGVYPVGEVESRRWSGVSVGQAEDFVAAPFDDAESGATATGIQTEDAHGAGYRDSRASTSSGTLKLA